MQVLLERVPEEAVGTGGEVIVVSLSFSQIFFPSRIWVSPFSADATTGDVKLPSMRARETRPPCTRRLDE
jgi:hypothetical protein